MFVALTLGTAGPRAFGQEPDTLYESLYERVVAQFHQIEAQLAKIFDKSAPCAQPQPPPIEESDDPPGAGVLWDIVKNKCVKNFRATRSPDPCEVVAIESGTGKGYAILKDRDGETHFLLIPTTRVTGIEDTKLLKPESTNYWQAAWSHAREILSHKAGRDVSRGEIALAINSIDERSQNQFHIHIDCLSSGIVKALKDNESKIGPDWDSSTSTIDVPGSGEHRVFFVAGEDLKTIDPFKILADDLSRRKTATNAVSLAMEHHGLIVIGAHRSDGKDGFYIMDASGYIGGSSEEALQSCT